MKLLGALALQFALLSLLAFGGANAVVPEMHRLAVEHNHWMTSDDFTGLFAISQAAPGPNFMISTLVGWRVAGIPGAVVATIAMCAPSCLVTFWASRLWDRAEHARWRRVLGDALAPVTVGLVAATFWLLAAAADHTAALGAITLASVAVAYDGRLNPLWAFGLAGCLGFLGFV
jgi:chromate transporter